MIEQEDTSVKVLCRFRPFNSSEQQDPNYEVRFPNTQTVELCQMNQSPMKFNFDYIFPPETRQDEVYAVTGNTIVDSIFQGFNGTVFVYGQTSSGKTHTMTGDLDDVQNQGLIPRMIQHIFDTIESTDINTEFTVKVGYMEIYLEKVKDLLNPRQNNLSVKEDRNKGIFVANLTEEYVQSQTEVLDYLHQGSLNRAMGATNMNEQSSRSHSIFQMTISQFNNSDLSSKISKLFLVDLAGSEKVGKTGAKGQRLEEAKQINKSLSCLGNVINALTDQNVSHVPYRESKLTRILQESLGGNAKTLLIVTCSPSFYNMNETISTLRFGIRAKSVKNIPKVNREYTVAELRLLIRNLQEEIVLKDARILELEGKPHQEVITTQLQVENEIQIEKTRLYDAIYTELQQKIRELDQSQEENCTLKDEIARYQSIVAELEQKILNKDNKIEELQLNLEFVEDKLNEVTSLPLPSPRGVSQNSSELKMLQIKCEQQERQIQLLQGALSESQIQNEEFNQLYEILLEQGARIEREKWENEKLQMHKALDNRISKVIELEMELNEIQELNQEILVQLSPQQQSIFNQLQTIRSNYEQLLSVYNKVNSKYIKTKITNKTLRKQNQELSNKAYDYEKQARYYSNEYYQAKELIDQLKQELQYPQASTHHMKIKKPIKGKGIPKLF